MSLNFIFILHKCFGSIIKVLAKFDSDIEEKGQLEKGYGRELTLTRLPYKKRIYENNNNVCDLFHQ